MPFHVELPVLGTDAPLQLHSGISTIIVGANGSGKTSLAQYCEQHLGFRAHRIAAQRMLALDPSIQKLPEEQARAKLSVGYAKPDGIGGLNNSVRTHQRWGQSRPDFILNDGEALLQVLFAQQSNLAVRIYDSLTDETPYELVESYLRRLRAIFNRVLPTRSLQTTADNITVCLVGDDENSQPYKLTDMSDGEKAVFYMIGQALVAQTDSVLIMDEPEIHVHRSILSRLWDELEAERPDCAFLLITHDLDFAASRAGKKYVTRRYAPATGWVIEEVPEADGFSEEIVTLILGSRKPILFVEGEPGSLDMALYRACYPDWTVIPRGGCESVIHSVVTMRANQALTRVTCAGLVDADGHTESDRTNLAEFGVAVLLIAEIENVLLLPQVSRVILEMKSYSGDELEQRLARLKEAVFSAASEERRVRAVALRYCCRRIDRMLKQLDFSGNRTTSDLSADYTQRTSAINVNELSQQIEGQIAAATRDNQLDKLLAVYDDKMGLLSLAATHLGECRQDKFLAWVTRTIGNKHDPRLRDAIRSALPVIAPG